MTIRDPYGEVLGTNNAGTTVYEYDKYTGSQISVLIGDVVIDDAVGLSFVKQQSKTPIYGFASQYFSFVADGHVLVQGSLYISFKEAGYLFYPIQRFLNRTANLYAENSETDWQNTAQTATSPRYSVNDDGEIVNYYKPQDYTFTEAAAAAETKRVMQANVEQMYNWQSRDGTPRQQSKYNQAWRELAALPDDKFEDWAEVFEDTIWFGSDKSNPFVRDKLFSKNIPPGTMINDEDVLSHRGADQYPAVDIFITYGDMSRKPANHTVKKLLDVHFIGQAQTLEVSDQPVLEKYDFLARTLV
jgi:hypothetical protein